MATRVLVVDDDDEVLEMLELLLRDAGFDPTVCSNGPEALAVFESSPSFDFVLCDYAMPAMNGVELAAEIRKFDSTLPIILMTGKASRLPEMFESGVVPLMKPFSIDLLRRVVGDLMSRPVPSSAHTLDVRIDRSSYH